MRRRNSRAGRAAALDGRLGQAGYTLVELLVVFALIALTLVLVGPRLTLNPPKPAPAEIAFMRELRGLAIKQGHPITVLVDDDMLVSSPPEKQLKLPPRARILVTQPPKSLYLPEQTITTFYPDGTAILGEFTVMQARAGYPDEVIYRAEINPITGATIYATP
jgi:hypothetical protein